MLCEVIWMALQHALPSKLIELIHSSTYYVSTLGTQQQTPLGLWNEMCLMSSPSYKLDKWVCPVWCCKTWALRGCVDDGGEGCPCSFRGHRKVSRKKEGLHWQVINKPDKEGEKHASRRLTVWRRMKKQFQRHKVSYSRPRQGHHKLGESPVTLTCFSL